MARNVFKNILVLRGRHLHAHELHLELAHKEIYTPNTLLYRFNIVYANTNQFGRIRRLYKTLSKTYIYATWCSY